jgi:membrane-associated phospholipid phosphatase
VLDLKQTPDWWLLHKLNGAGQPHSVRRAGMLLTGAADANKLWLIVAGVLAGTGRRGRRAGLHGVAGIGATELVVAAVKQVVRRPRPAGLWSTGLQRSGRSPRSSSFPSSHSASAAAFTFAAGREAPAALIVIVPVALAVGWSRPLAGRHFPTDVLGGAVIGALIGLCTRPPIRAAAHRQGPRQ